MCVVERGQRRRGVLGVWQVCGRRKGSGVYEETADTGACVCVFMCVCVRVCGGGRGRRGALGSTPLLSSSLLE